jgi:uncharacterized membrane protein
MGASPVEEADQLSPSQRSTIRRAVKEAIARHDVEWAMRNTCAEFQQKYGISYEAIELLMQDALPSALPEELLSSGQRNRFRRKFRAVNSLSRPLQIQARHRSVVSLSNWRTSGQRTAGWSATSPYCGCAHSWPVPTA